MRAIARSISQCRSALQHQACQYSSGFVRRQKLLTNTYSGFVYKHANNAEFDIFQRPRFSVISRALSIDAAHITNGGTLLFWVVLYTFLSSLVHKEA